MTDQQGQSALFLLRDPALSRTHIAFSYGGDIWVMDRGGSRLRRLTSSGHEGKPAFSPDGTYIAFIGEYRGPRGVFVIPTEGGEPRRLTHHSDDLNIIGSARVGGSVGWTPDGKRVLFSSARAAFAGGASSRIVQLFTVPFEGGLVTALPLVRAAEGSFSPDGTRMAYVPIVQTQGEWKRYRGGQTTPIWITNLSGSKIEEKLPRDNSNDSNPMWVGETIYFLSDRNGPVTLFAYDLRLRQVRQIVTNEGFDIKSACASCDAIVYEQFGSLHVLDLISGENRVLDVRPVADFAELTPHCRELADIIGSDVGFPEVRPKLSPTGEYAVFGIRGEILTVPAEHGEIRNITQTPGTVERDASWSPDGQFIAYFSDESGEYALHISEQGGLGVERKIDLGVPPTLYYSPTWAPDSRKIAYIDKRLNYWYVDLEIGSPVRIDTDLFVNPVSAMQLSWSPDSCWIAYSKQLPNHLHAAFVYSIGDGQSFQLTDGSSDVLHVVFDRGGEYLYFTASTDLALGGEWFSMMSYHRPVTRSVHALLLNNGVAMPLLPQSNEECTLSHAPLEALRREKVEIDVRYVDQRIIRLPVPARNYGGLFAGRSGMLFLLERPPADAGQGVQQVHRFSLASRHSEQILEGISYFDLSFNGEKMLYSRLRGKKREWFIASALEQDAETCESVEGRLNFKQVQVDVNPRLEWEHLYDQIWRVQRDCLYDPGLHGLDLKKIKERYRPFLENIVSRRDLNYLFNEMLGNLAVGHTSASIKDDGPNRLQTKLGLLGADYGVDSNRYRFSRVYAGDPWNPLARSPLREAGRRVEPGEYLLAINGRDVHPTVDVNSYLEGTAGEQISLKVGPHPDGTGSREVTVVPTEDEYPLRYFAWIERNRRKVEELAGGRVAYVHLPDCTLNGYTVFNRYFFAQVDKEAVIIDCRFNNGGQMADYVIENLRRTLLFYLHMREGRDVSVPSLSIFGPKVMLINEMTTSAGEILSWSFRKAGVGPLVGTRTWGGTVGHYGFASDLLDDSGVTNPNFAFYTPEGSWELENVGVSPDFEVEEDPEACRTDRDVQLEKAVEVVMGLLNGNPPWTVPQHPPYPHYRHEK